MGSFAAFCRAFGRLLESFWLWGRSLDLGLVLAAHRRPGRLATVGGLEELLVSIEVPKTRVEAVLATEIHPSSAAVRCWWHHHGALATCAESLHRTFLNRPLAEHQTKR